ncbi:MAG: ABC transporter ATP-binding protein [Deltaproteobacteria bacterium]|nr:ABC transporter ATP-binding protein [Deltaproteobacteria bacterium]
MNGKPAIELQGVSKKYRRHTTGPRATTLKSYLLHDLWRHQNGGEKLKWALRDLDLRIAKGTSLGIIGRNGSGKSTLLKLLTGIIKPDAGTLTVNGRVSALLELGAGFHPELTGRENVKIHGVIMGLSQSEIKSQLEAIIEFAELRDYIDDPVRTYSSGMYMRLAFSAAIHIDPEILLVDEVLAVGDGAFVEKCLECMDRFKSAGKTIILVTHNLQLVRTWCHEAIWLDDGQLQMNGDPGDVVAAYRSRLFDQQARGTATLPVEVTGEGTRSLRYGDGTSTLLEYGILDSSGKMTDFLESGAACTLFMRVRIDKAFSGMTGGFAIKDRMGTILYGVTNRSQKMLPRQVHAGEVITFTAKLRMWLAAGEYYITLGLANIETDQKSDFIEDALHFTVIGPAGLFTESVVNLETEFTINSDEGGDACKPEQLGFSEIS